VREKYGIKPGGGGQVEEQGEVRGTHSLFPHAHGVGICSGACREWVVLERCNVVLLRRVGLYSQSQRPCWVIPGLC
jgi:hypothetical protein